MNWQLNTHGDARFALKINGETIEVEAQPDEPLLWVLRDTCNITSPKYGCGAARCGACTVHVDGIAVRSCLLPAAECIGKNIVTIEGLADGENLHPLQQAWIQENVPQCGYCQCGQIMSAAALVEKNPKPSNDDIAVAMSGNLCRCGTYPRIVKAIKRATGQL